MRRHLHRFGCALIAIALLAGCDDQPTAPRLEAAPDFAILDGARGGTAHFFFLPPMVPAPGYSGTFDGTQSPEVRICELVANGCSTTIASFSGAEVKVELEAEAYQARWKTRGAGLDASKIYRIEVLLGTEVLGYADVVVLANGSQIRTVDSDQYVATINGGTLPIRFRIETAAPAPPPPPPGGWQDGDVITHIQADWGDHLHAAGALLATYFNFVYSTAGGVLEVGLSGAAGHSILISSAGAIHDYLPSTGAVGPLNADLVDPTSTASGAFGGEVVALALNIDFSDAGHTLGAAGIPFGDLTLCNLTATPGLNGSTIRQFAAVANTALGGGATPYALLDIHTLAQQVNGSFNGGLVTLFAQQHIVNGACPN